MLLHFEESCTAFIGAVVVIVIVIVVVVHVHLDVTNHFGNSNFVVKCKFQLWVLEYLDPVYIFFKIRGICVVLKLNSFWGDLTDISAR